MWIENKILLRYEDDTLEGHHKGNEWALEASERNLQIWMSFVHTQVDSSFSDAKVARLVVDNPLGENFEIFPK